MKKSLIALTAAAVAISATVATAGPHRYSTSRGFTDTARVTNVQPLYRTVSISRPSHECVDEEVYRPVDYEEYDDDARGRGGNTALGMIVGGVLGGALGHNISRHHGDTAKIVGAVVGSAIGHDVAQRNHERRRVTQRDYRPRWVQHCHTVNERTTEERLDGYRVTYRYHGQSFTTHMDHDPGSQLQVRVKVTPVY